jgi:hypothetical protein
MGTIVPERCLYRPESRESRETTVSGVGVHLYRSGDLEVAFIRGMIVYWYICHSQEILSRGIIVSGMFYVYIYEYARAKRHVVSEYRFKNNWHCNLCQSQETCSDPSTLPAILLRTRPPHASILNGLHCASLVIQYAHLCIYFCLTWHTSTLYVKAVGENRGYFL